MTGRTYEVVGANEKRFDKAGISPLKGNLYLRGQLVYEPAMEALVFLGIPSLADFDELKEFDLSLEQFPVHSNGRDMLFAAVRPLQAESCSVICYSLAFCL